jgi:hypothetical protein
MALLLLSRRIIHTVCGMIVGGLISIVQLSAERGEERPRTRDLFKNKNEEDHRQNGIHQWTRSHHVILFSATAVGPSLFEIGEDALSEPAARTTANHQEKSES